MFEIKSSKLALNTISIYRNLLEDTVIKKLKALLDYISGDEKQLSIVLDLYNEFFYNLAQSEANSLEEHIIDKILFDENSFSKGFNSYKPSNKKDFIKEAVHIDLENLQLVSRVNPRTIKNYLLSYFSENEFKYIIQKLPEWTAKCAECNTDDYPEHINIIKKKLCDASSWSEFTEELEVFHKNYGYGAFAEYRAFVWERANGKGYFNGIKKPDSVEIEDLIGYEVERSVIIENTVQFLNGYSGNNVLLHGDRGTGKSSTVKAILNKYYTEGLRMIEVPKAYLTDFPDIIRNLKDRTQRFIIFVDDLVFGDDEESYTALKAILEGGLESKSSNILIYATSNRRHLVKEYFSERLGNNGEEVHSGDSVQEKLSLADRFGINVVFSSPDQKKYLEIVDGIAAKRNLNIDRDVLHSEAKKWELWYNGRSARTARQFVDWIEGQDKSDK